MQKTALPGIDKFLSHYPHARALLVGAQGISIESFLLTPLINGFD